MYVYINYENYKMLYYDRDDNYEGTDVNKTSESKECNTGHYWYINGLNSNQISAMDPMMSMNFSDIAILNSKGADYCCIISKFCKVRP